jgi:hypothetical protein
VSQQAISDLLPEVGTGVDIDIHASTGRAIQRIGGWPGLDTRISEYSNRADKVFEELISHLELR